MSFEERIPKEVKDELDDIVNHTKKTNREESITFCKKPDSSHIFVAAAAKGKEGSTEVEECNIAFGHSTQVGAAHTHPVTGIGTLPSEGDLVGSLEESLLYDNKQVNCVANHEAPYIECWQPKAVPDRKKVNEYRRAAADLHRTLSNPYFYDNTAKDFEFAFYDRKSGEHIGNPDPKKVVKGAIGRARPGLRKRLKEMEIPGFCHMVEDLTGSDPEVFNACKAELRTKKFLGLIPY